MPRSSAEAGTRWSTGWPTISPGSTSIRCCPRSAPVGCGPSCRRRPPRHRRSSPRCWPTSIVWSCPASRTGSHRTSSPTSRRTTRVPSILAELAAAGLGVQGMLWQTSPACTELETHVLDWMVDLLGLPVGVPVGRPRRRCHPGHGLERDAVRTTGRAGACHRRAHERRRPGWHCRYRAHGLRDEPGPQLDREGRPHRRHRQRQPALGRHRPGPGDAPSALDAAITADRAAGRTPCFVVRHRRHHRDERDGPAAGDRRGLPARTGVWLHVDAAMSGSAAICPEFRHLQDGLDGGRQLLREPAQVAADQLRL